MITSPESVLAHLFNLRCGKGHRFFSPTPTAWVGTECGYVIGKSEKDRPIKCKSKVRRYKP
jgi:hypothetical protein